MENALKFFNYKSLLKIDNFETSHLRHRFHELAGVLLNQTLLEVNKSKYRICEIEFYVHSDAHRDPYAHQHPEQLKFGTWYFHQLKTKKGYSFKGGNYKGLDITLGDGKSFVGILIRSIESSGERIDGPSLVVDEILNCLKIDSVAEAATSNEHRVSLIFEPSLESQEFFMGPRVGLYPTAQNEEISLQFLFMPFRYITQPAKTKKGKALLFLYQASLYGMDKAVERIGVREAEAKKYLNWFENGLKENIVDLQFGEKIAEQCKFFGAHCAHYNSDSSDEAAEVTPEQLHEMAVAAFREGDQEQLKCLCDLGVESCGNRDFGLEFLKLRGIYHAQSGDLLNARKDFLSVLEVIPSDEVAFTNYITACLEAEDRTSVLQAIRLFYPTFDDATKLRVLDSIAEAINVGTLSVEELPGKLIADQAQFLKIKRAV